MMTDSNLVVEKVNNLHDLECIKPDWDRLIHDSETRTAELTYEWQISYWKHFQQNAELFILLVRDRGEVTAICPLKLQKTRFLGLKFRTLEMIAAQESNYQDLIIGRNSSEVIHSILSYLLQHRDDWDELNLWHLPAASTTAAFLSIQLCHYPLRANGQTDQCIYLFIDTNWEDYKKSLGKDRRHRMKNKFTRLEREVGKLQLKNSTDTAELSADLDRFFDLHRKRWKATDTPSQFLDQRFCDFYQEAGLLLQGKGQLGLSRLEAGEKLLAQLIYFAFDQEVLIQLIAYDPDYYAYSPMLVLQEMFVEQSLANGAKIVDWGTYYAWKELWANHRKNRVNLQIYPTKPVSWLHYQAGRSYAALRETIFQHPRLFNFFKSTRDRIRNAQAIASQRDE